MRQLVKVLSLVSALVLAAAACGGGEEEAPSSGPKPVRVVTSSTGQAYVGQFHAPELFGDKFGLAPNNQLTEFEDEGAAAQVLVSGGADAGSTGLTQVIQLISRGQKLKAFCPVQVDSTEHLVGLKEKIS
ncbi:MAG TPA: hypothetical protein VHA34_11320, partial [Actinomycetes bacterium]|nr:hypothetical protein [Actinomycetes bacterium]